MPGVHGLRRGDVLMQQIADDLADVQVLVGRPRPGPEPRVLEGGRL
jgi:hypothetical protein